MPEPLTAADLKSYRERLGLTQAQLAARLGVDAMTVSRWERGAQGIRHAAALRLQLEALLRTPASAAAHG